MVVMAQDFKMRYPLVSGHGNMGSMDGDPAAAMRYTEAKLSPIGELMLQDIDKDTVDTQPNYDESEREPVVLPGLFPELLANGSSGIAVGMACSFAPHCVKDIYKALDKIIDDTLQGKKTSIDDLIDIVQAPDFPTGGTIVNLAEVHKAYREGRGTVRVRSKYHIEQKRRHELIVITELPYGVNKRNMVKLIDKKRLSDPHLGIRLVRDESDREGIRVVIELNDGVNHDVVIRRLLKETPMQSTFSINHTAVVNGHVREHLSLQELLNLYLMHVSSVVYRRTSFDMRKANERKHIVDGICLVLDNIDRAIAIIRGAENEAVAIEELKAFGLDETQGKAVCAMRLGTLAHASIEKYQNEQDSLANAIEHYHRIVSSPQELLKEMRQNLDVTAAKFDKDERHTDIGFDILSNADERDLVPDKDIVITYTQNGIIKAMEQSTYSSQNRGTRGQKAGDLHEDDVVKDVITLSNKDDLLFFTDKGVCHTLPAYKIPLATKSQRGKYVVNYIDLEEGENIVSMLAANKEHEGDTILMATRKGTLKRVSRDIFSTRLSHTRVITLNDGDTLAGVTFMKEGQHALLVTAMGMGLHLDPFAETSGVRCMGRTAAGVRGINLQGNDVVVAVLPVTDGELLTMTEGGHAKRMDFSGINPHGRGTRGVSITKVSKRVGAIVTAVAIHDEDDLFIVTQQGKINRISTSHISKQSKAGSGVKCIKLETGDCVVAVSATEHEEEEDGE